MNPNDTTQATAESSHRKAYKAHIGAYVTRETKRFLYEEAHRRTTDALERVTVSELIREALDDWVEKQKRG